MYSYRLILKRFYSTFKPHSVNPLFWLDLVDAEGSLTLIIGKSKTYKIRWIVKPKFQIELHVKDLDLLYLLQIYLQGIVTYLHILIIVEQFIQ